MSKENKARNKSMNRIKTCPFMALNILRELLIKDAANSGYIGEPVSKASHMLGAAFSASQQGMNDEVIIASLFHDIGHLLAPDDTGGFGVSNHADLGAALLTGLGFPESVCGAIRHHADAKRYHIGLNTEYQLSPASRRTLEFQGGPMTIEQQEEFRRNPSFQAALRVREADENAKTVEYDKESIRLAFNTFVPFMLDLLDRKKNCCSR